MPNANAMKTSTRTKQENMNEVVTEKKRKTTKKQQRAKCRDQEINFREKKRPQLGFTHHGNVIAYTKGNKDNTDKSTCS